ncbi:MAG: hypothetical protein ACXVJW_08785, partial [Acidimicrobiia bacterium]
MSVAVGLAGLAVVGTLNAPPAAATNTVTAAFSPALSCTGWSSVTVPTGLVSATFTTYGAGGAGGDTSGGTGGSGGKGAKITGTLAVSAGQVLWAKVGCGGLGTGAGGPGYVAGGATTGVQGGGGGGATALCVGTVTAACGSGTVLAVAGGGGGGGAGTSCVSNQNGGAGGDGNSGTASTGGTSGENTGNGKGGGAGANGGGGDPSGRGGGGAGGTGTVPGQGGTVPANGIAGAGGAGAANSTPGSSGVAGPVNPTPPAVAPATGTGGAGVNQNSVASGGGGGGLAGGGGGGSGKNSQFACIGQWDGAGGGGAGSSWVKSSVTSPDFSANGGGTAACTSAAIGTNPGFGGTGGGDGCAGNVTVTFTVNSTTASFTTQPGGGTGAIAWATQPVVTVKDFSNTGVPGEGVSLAITGGTGTAGATLTCTSGLTVTSNASGQASFGGCSIDKAGNNYTLTATDTVTNVTVASSPFNVSVGSPTKLAFAQQPSNATAGASISPAVTVQVQDAGGNLTTSTVSVTVAIGTNPGGGTLSGTIPIDAVNGTATFSNLSINKVGTGYTLHATSGSLTAADSTPFNITAAGGNQFVFTTPAVSGSASSAATSGANLGPITVQEQDAFGNPVTAGVGGTTVNLAS